MLITIGPYQFFRLIFNYIFDKGFATKNFLIILFSLLQIIPPDLMADGHLVLLYRMVMLHNSFSGMDLVPSFLALLESIIKDRSYYLKKSFPELTYVEFNKVFPLPEVPKIHFPQFIYEEIEILNNQVAEGEALYESANIS